MGFWGLFKKKETVAPQNKEKEQAVKPQGTAYVRSEEKPAPAPVIEEKREAAAGPSKEKTMQTSGRPTQAVRWPMNGTNAGWLAGASYFFVYADASFLRSPGAKAFAETWEAEKAKKNLKRTWFVPQFELDVLSEDERKAIEQWNGSYSVRTTQKNYEELFKFAAGMAWNVVFLTVRGSGNAALRKAAADVGASVQLYSAADTGKIYQIFVEATQTTKREPNVYSTAPKAEAVPVNAFGTPMRLDPAIRRALRLPVRIPGAGTAVRTDQGEVIRLNKPVMSNSTSITYSTDNPSLYAKIYTAELLATTMPEQKCRLMLTRQIKIPGVRWPISALTGEDGVFVGILVEKSEGFQLYEALQRETTVRQYFDGWNKQDMTALALTILRMIQQLQKWNVCFGCLNPAAILVKDKNTVTFVDMDEWQIEGYPVLFDKKEYIPPELQKTETRLHFYNPDEINYQIAYLMFMLMMPGRKPYAQRRGSTQQEGIINQEFGFGMGKEMPSTIKEADSSAGFWKFVWDHISYHLGVDFYQTFARGGKASTADKRFSIEKWIGSMNEYHRELASPYDPESKKLYPSTFRRDAKRTFVKCSLCGTEHPSFYIQRDMRIPMNRSWVSVELSKIVGNKNICKNCYHDSAREYFPGDPKASFVCEGCEEEFFYTNRAKFMHEYMESYHNWMPQKWCPNCQEPYEERCCEDCGEKFVITVGQYKSFSRKGYNLPKRCSKCRQKKKAAHY